MCVLDILRNCGDTDVTREACWVIINAVTGANVEQMQYIFEQGSMDAIFGLFDLNDNRMTLWLLKAYKKFLKMSLNEKLSVADREKYVKTANKIGVPIKFKQLARSEDEGIKTKAKYLIDTYFNK